MPQKGLPVVDFNFSLDDDWIDEIEFDDDSPKKEKKEEKVWCALCQDYIKRSEMKYWSGDDRPALLCPGCDQTLIWLPREEE